MRESFVPFLADAELVVDEVHTPDALDDVANQAAILHAGHGTGQRHNMVAHVDTDSYLRQLRKPNHNASCRWPSGPCRP